MNQGDPFWDAVMFVPFWLIVLVPAFLIWRAVMRMLPVALTILFVAARLHAHEIRAKE